MRWRAPEHKKKYLAPICAGDARSTVAFLEADASWNPADIHMAAANGALTGAKLFVPDAAVADFIVVIARNGIFAVASKAPGMKITPMLGMDLTRKLYRIEFQNTPAEKIGDVSALAKGFDVATTALVCELVGGMQRTLDITVEYAKMRKQFGKPIGMFQAVQHQCADMYLETESSRSAAYYAAWALEENAPDASVVGIDRENVCERRGSQCGQSRDSSAWRDGFHVGKRRASLLSAGEISRKQLSAIPRSTASGSRGL